jgi:D-inositol-3-phosphate glycosyltransferase
MTRAAVRSARQTSRSPEHTLCRLGMLFDGLCHKEDQILFGMQTAVEGFMRAFFQHGALAACDLFASATTMEAAKSHIAGLTTGAEGPAGDVWPLELLPSRLASLAPIVLHDPTGDLCRLHYLRSQVAPGPNPITVIHYTVSYLCWRYQMILPLLMAGYRPCDAVICSGSAARRAVAALLGQVQEAIDAEYGLKLPFRGRLEVIPLGVDTTVFRPRDQAEARVQLGLPPDKLILLGLGRFSPWDKMDLAPLLEVFRELRRTSRRELLLVLAGSDPHGYAATVRRLAQELGLQADVQFLTNLSPFFPPLLYAAADIFISLSDNIQEMFGQTPVEAMAVGLPVIVSDWDGYRETVIHGETGFRVPTLWGQCDADLCRLAPLVPYLEDHALLAQSVAVDPEKLFECLKLLTEDDRLRRRLGEAGRQRAVMEYDWSKVIRRYETLWEELSEHARTLPDQTEKHLSFIRPDYIGAFGHFATRLLSPEMRLRLTQFGEQTLAGREPLRLSSPVASHFDTRALRQALALLRVAGRFRRSPTVRMVGEMLCERHGLLEPAAQRHILWLMKYGLVALVEDR